MSQFIPDKASFGDLKDKVVVVTGGSSGIGAATVSQLHTAGASVVFGDVSAEAGKDLASSLGSAGSGGSAVFVECNVADYADNYRLFKTAYDRYGRVDHAVACAGIFEQSKWFDPELTIESVGKAEEANSKVLDVNLYGTCVFARIAAVFLKDGMQKGENKSITLLASVASIRDSPGAFLYQTTKHGILGLMRSSRKILHERDGLRINCVCPGMTESSMTVGIIEKFRERGLAHQTSEAVAEIILGIEITSGMTGKSVYVEGGLGWEFEDGIYSTMPQWLGEKPTRMLRDNATFVASGALLKKD